MTPETQLDPNVQITAIADVAKQTGQNCFKIRISQRAPGSPYPRVVAAFDDATVEQIAHPEGWLGRVGGGGTYLFTVFHPVEQAKTIGGPIIIQVGGAAKTESVTPDITNELDWTGPKTMSFPTAAPQPQRRTALSYLSIPSSTPGDGGGSTPRNGDQRNLNGDPTVPGFYPPAFDPRLAAMQAQLEQDRAALQRDREEAQRQRHLAEMAAERQRNELDLAKLRTEIAAAAASKPSGSDTVLQLIVEMNKQSQEAQRRSDERFATIMAQMNQGIAAQMAGVQETNKILMQKALEKPTIDPLMEKLLAKDSDSAAATARVVAQMAEASGAMMNMMVGAIHAVAEINNPPDSEPVWLKAMKEGLKAYATMQQPPQMPQIPRMPLSAPPQQQIGAPPPKQRAAAPSQANGAAPHFGDADGSQLNAFTQIVKAIRERRNVIEIATFFLDNADTDASIQTALQAANMNPLEAFEPYLRDWAQDPQNQQYIFTLMKEVERIYNARQAQAQGDDEPSDPSDPSRVDDPDEEEDDDGELAQKQS